MKTIAIFPGRFQPFGPHHWKAYKWLVDEFGISRTYIATSDKTGPKSPLNFNEKKKIIMQYNIPSSQIVECEKMYSCIEITRRYHKDTTALVFMVGEKDEGRLNIDGKLSDGSDSYFKTYSGQRKLNPMSKNGYAIISPHFNMTAPGVGKINGTNLRKFVKNAQPSEFHKVFGWFKNDLYKLMQSKFRLSESTENFFLKMFEGTELFARSTPKKKKEDIPPKKPLEIPKQKKTISEGGAHGRIHHPHSNPNFTFQDLFQIIKMSLGGSIQNPVEKVDGQNLMVTIKDGNVGFARNKSTIANPMSTQELSEKFKDRGAIHDSFVNAANELQNILQKFSPENAQEFFGNGQKFMNVEILDSNTSNVIDYGNPPKLIILGMMQYDEGFNLVGSEPVKGIDPQEFSGEGPYEVTANSTVEIEAIPEASKLIASYNQKLMDIIYKSGLTKESTLSEYYKIINDRSAITPLEIMFLSMGADVLKHVRGFMCGNPEEVVESIKQRLEDIRNEVQEPDTQKFKKNWNKLEAAGGMDKIVPLEGIIFKFNDNKIKLVGVYQPINQILGLNRYNTE